MRKAFLLIQATAVFSWQTPACHHLSLSWVPPTPTESQQRASILSQTACQLCEMGKLAFSTHPLSLTKTGTQGTRIKNTRLCKGLQVPHSTRRWSKKLCQQQQRKDERFDVMNSCWCRRWGMLHAPQPLRPSLHTSPLLREKQPQSHWSFLLLSLQLNSSRMKKS